MHATNTAVPFVANAGQTDAQVAYTAQLFAGALFVTHRGELVYSLPAVATPAGGRTGWTLTERFIDGHPQPVGIGPTGTRVSFLRGGDRSAWQRDIETFAALELGEVWKGVGVELRAHGANVEKVFTVAPSVSPGSIRLAIDGSRSLSVDSSGSLRVGTGLGEVRLSAPIAYQELHGQRQPVQVAYVVQGPVYGFAVGAYDATRPLIIDPVLQATYSGGTEDDFIRAVAVGPTGDIYVGGNTSSTNFPGVAGGAQSSLAVGVDGFVARYNATLTALLQATYFGGGGEDRIHALAVDATSVYIGGSTRSTNLPGVAGGAVPAMPAGTTCAAFVARLPLALTSVTQATYLAGANDGGCFNPELLDKRVNAIVLSGTEVYVTGNYSGDAFPLGAGGAPPVPFSSSAIGFVSRLNLALTTINQSSGLGNNLATTLGNALAVDGSNVYVAGITTGGLTGSAGGAQPLSGGGADGFVMQFNAALTAVQQSTFIGGSGADRVFAMALSGGEVFVHGETDSTNLPNTAGGAQPLPAGNLDGFVARFNAALTSNPQSTYLGGSVIEFAYSMVASGGSIYVAGFTNSNDFPDTAGGIEPTSCGGCSYVARLAPSLTTIQQATYYGGPTRTDPFAMTATGSEIILAGMVTAAGLPGAIGGAQPTLGGAGNQDGFVARLTADLLGAAGAAPVIITASPLPAATVGVGYVATIAATGDAPITFTVTLGSLPTSR